MTSKDPKEPYDFFYYWNNQQNLPQAHDKKQPPTRDPFDKDKREAQMLEFERLNKPGQYRDYNDKRQQNPSAPIYANTYGEGSSGSSWSQARGGGKSAFDGGGNSMFEQ